MPATTTHGLPYPVAADPVKDGAAAVQALAEALDNPPWTSVTAFTGTWTNYGSGCQAAAYRRIGDMVEVRGVISSGTSGTSAFTLPTGYRPSAINIFPAVGSGGFAYVTVTSTGTFSPTGATGQVAIACRFSV